MGNIRKLRNVQPGSIVYLDPSHTSYHPDSFALLLAVHEMPEDRKSAAFKAYEQACGWLTKPRSLASLMMIGIKDDSGFVDFGALVDAGVCVEISSRDEAAKHLQRKRTEISDMQATAKMVSQYCDELRVTLQRIAHNSGLIQAGHYNRDEIGDDPTLPILPPSIVLTKSALALAIGHVFCLEGATEAGRIDGESEITITVIPGCCAGVKTNAPEVALILAVRMASDIQHEQDGYDEEQRPINARGLGLLHSDQKQEALLSIMPSSEDVADLSSQQTTPIVPLAEAPEPSRSADQEEVVKPSFGQTPRDAEGGCEDCGRLDNNPDYEYYFVE